MNNSHSKASDTPSHHDVPFPAGIDSVDSTNDETSGCPRPAPSTGSTDVSICLKRVLKLIKSVIGSLSDMTY